MYIIENSQNKQDKITIEFLQNLTSNQKLKPVKDFAFDFISKDLFVSFSNDTFEYYYALAQTFNSTTNLFSDKNEPLRYLRIPIRTQNDLYLLKSISSSSFGQLHHCDIELDEDGNHKIINLRKK